MSKASSQERKEQILSIATTIFANLGYYKTTTAMIAKEAGVTQPYLFHFYKTKEELYLAVLEKGVQTIHDAFERVNAPKDQLVQQLGETFNDLLHQKRNEMLLTMHSFVTSETSVRTFSREKYLYMSEMLLHKFIAAGIENAPFAVKSFIGEGLMLTVAEVLDAPKLSPK